MKKHNRLIQDSILAVGVVNRYESGDMDYDRARVAILTIIDRYVAKGRANHVIKIFRGQLHRLDLALDNNMRRALLMLIMPFFFWTGIVDQINGEIALVERAAGEYVEIDLSAFNCTPSEGDSVVIGANSATCR